MRELSGKKTFQLKLRFKKEYSYAENRNTETQNWSFNLEFEKLKTEFWSF